MSDATIFTLKQAEKFYSEEYDLVFQLMANCPNRKSIDIINAHKYFIENKIHFLRTCIPFQGVSPWWSFTLDVDNNPKYIFPKYIKSRSQDLENSYCTSGAIWIAQKKSLINEGSFIGKNHKSFPISWFSGFDIDNMDDLIIAKSISNL